LENFAFMRAEIATAQFYAEHLLVKVPGLRYTIVAGADSVCAMALVAF
jgi:3-(methylthio)propanoyl-CoA dehydrogenase